MSPVAPVMASRNYSTPPIEGERIHPSLSGLYFTPMAANAIQDIYTHKMRPDCLLNRLCLHSRNDLRQQFSQLLQQVDERVQPRIEGNSQQGIYVMTAEVVWTSEALVKLLAGHDPQYAYDYIAGASGFLVYNRSLKPGMQIKADAVLLKAARFYYANVSDEFRDTFTPSVWAEESLSVKEFRQIWQELMNP